MAVDDGGGGGVVVGGRDDRYTGPTLLEAMEGIADGIATTSSLDQAALLLAKRPVFGKTRVCVMRRLSSSSVRRVGGESSKESEQGGGGEAGIVAVVALIQSGTVRQGQALEALLPGSRLLAHHPAASRKTRRVTHRPSMMARYRVVSIQRFGKSMYAPISSFVMRTHTHTHTHNTPDECGLIVCMDGWVWHGGQTARDGKRDRGTGTKTRTSLSATPTSASTFSTTSARHCSAIVEVRRLLLHW
jgi:hypothetical protein